MYNKRKLQKKKKTLLAGRKKLFKNKKRIEEELTKEQISKIKDMYTRGFYK